MYTSPLIMTFENSLSFAQKTDAQDPLRSYREQFYFPQHKGRNTVYFCGNSLGLQPKGVAAALQYELEHWKTHAVEGHFLGEMPWMYYHRFLVEQSATVVGAKPEEVVVMNTLTTNLHLMMVSFYRPSRERFKIVMEGGAFPSDQYAVETQIRFHGYSPEEAIIEILPREGEELIRPEDLLQTIEKHGPETALVLLGGVNYYTGQYFDLPAITAAGHRAGAQVGFDLAHAAGNVPLQLHEWDVDFAVWCSYKYLNSGPGGPGGVFVHERHARRPDLPRFGGWWGHNEERRFLMEKGFEPMNGAAGWQLSNAQIFSFAAHKVSLDIFHEVGMAALRQKSELLTAYLEYLLDQQQGQRAVRLITPQNPAQRGCQMSFYVAEKGKELHENLSANGVVSDWREAHLPGEQGGVIRIAPVPLYNSFEDVYRFARLLGGEV